MTAARIPARRLLTPGPFVRPPAGGGRSRRASSLLRWIPLAVAAATVLLLTIVSVHAVGTAVLDLHPPRARIDHEVGRRIGMREVAFRTSDNVTLQGWYLPPRNGATIVLAHGWAGSRQQLLPEARMLARHGFGVLLFDFRAHGESGGSVVTSGDRERLDVAAALEFARVNGGPSGTRLGGVGFSMGGAALAEVAAADPGVKAVLLESVPPTAEEDVRADHPRWRPLAPWIGLMVHRAAGMDLSAVHPIDDLCRIRPRPLLLVYGDVDPAFSTSTGKRMLDAACDPKALWIVPHAGHGRFAELVPEDYERVMVQFFSRALLPPAPADGQR